MVVEAPEELLHAALSHAIVADAQLPKWLGRVPKVARESTDSRVCDAIAGEHDAARSHLESCQRLEELGGIGVSKAYTANIERL